MALVRCDTLEDSGPTGPPPPTCRLAALTASDTTYLDQLLADDTPQVAGDSLVAGVAFDSTGPRIVYTYDLRSRALRRYPLPNVVAWEVSIAPGARYIAYTTENKAGLTTTIVREFPNGPVIVETPGVSIGATDAQVSAIRWFGPDSVGLYFQPEGLDETRWLRYRARLPAGRLQLDTIDLQ